MSRFGLTVRCYAGEQRDLGSNLLQLSFLFKSCGLWTLSCDFVPHNEILKRLSSLPILMQESFWWWQCRDRSLKKSPSFPSLHSPFSPSLISLVVSVDVKHHVYFHKEEELGRKKTKKKPQKENLKRERIKNRTLEEEQTTAKVPKNK